MAAIAIRYRDSVAKRERERLAVKTTVDALQSTKGVGVPFVLENLADLPDDFVLAEISERYPVAKGQMRSNLAYGLAQLGNVKVDIIIEALTNEETEGSEVDNIVNALRYDESKSLEKIKFFAAVYEGRRGWVVKARLAIAALHLGDDSLVSEMLQGPPERLQQTLELPDLLAGFRKQVEQIMALPEGRRNTAASRMGLARAYYYLEEYEKALIELAQPVNFESASAEFWFLRAVCEAHCGLNQESKRSLLELVKATSSPILVRYGQILVTAGLGDLKEGETQLKIMIADFAKDPVAQYTAACIAAQFVRISRRVNSPDAPKFKSLTLKLLRKAYCDLGYKGSAGSQYVIRVSREIDNDFDLIPLRNDKDFLALATELKPQVLGFNPIQRTVFIREFAEWSGSVGALAELFSGTSNQALRSGISLALGGIKRPGKDAKEKWQPILSRWYTDAIDSYTHSSAGWALTKWKLEMPEITSNKNPSPGRAWWHEPNGLRFVRIKGGGAARTGRPIHVCSDFWLSDSEVTNAIYRQFLQDKPFHEKIPGWASAKPYIPRQPNGRPIIGPPVTQVSWYEAVLFCNWLSDELGLAPCYVVTRKDARRRDFEVKWIRDADGVRLPTEAEWEYACRSGAHGRFCFGDYEKDLPNYGWFDGNSDSRIQLVRDKCCNGFGLFDMHGNALEWCWDLHSMTDLDRAARGGSVRYSAQRCQSGSRFEFSPKGHWGGVGFRVACGPVSQASE